MRILALAVRRAARSATRSSSHPFVLSNRLSNFTSPSPLPISSRLVIRSFASSARPTILTRLQRLGATATQLLQTTYSDDRGATTADKSSVAPEPKLELSRLLDLAKPERKLIAFALGAQLISASSIMLFPLALGQVVDTVTATSSMDLDALVAIMAGVFGVSAVASATRVSTMSLAGSRISRTLRTSLFHAILRQDTAFFDRRQSGELVNRLSSDVPLVSRTLTENVANMLRSGVTSVASLGLILYLSPKLSLVALASIPSIVIFAALFGRAARNLSKELVDALAAATQVAAERMSAIRTVRMFGAEDFEAKRYARRVDDTYDLAKKVAMADGLYAGSVQLSAQLSLCGVLWFGGRMVVDTLDPMTMGALTSFSMYAVNLGVAVSGMGTAYGQLTRALGAGYRIFEVIDRKPEDTTSTISHHGAFEEIEAGKGEQRIRTLKRLERGYDATVRFEDVHFAYPTQPDAPILNGVNLTIRPGEIMAVAGASGSGKSTLSALLYGLYEPISGKITLGGESITDLDAAWLRKQVAVVAQEPILFDGTVTDNIRYAMAENVSQEQVELAAKAAASHDMIMSLPKQYETMVGERGAALSGGQRARTALCRALVRQPRILVLDEHTAGLHGEAERAVAHAINNAASELNMAVITIAHRTSSLRRAHRVAVLVDGTVAEIAPFDELMALKNSHLRKMVNPQG